MLQAKVLHLAVDLLASSCNGRHLLASMLENVRRFGGSASEGSAGLLVEDTVLFQA